jgi:hypothetical protein
VMLLASRSPWCLSWRSQNHSPSKWFPWCIRRALHPRILQARLHLLALLLSRCSSYASCLLFRIFLLVL